MSDKELIGDDVRFDELMHRLRETGIGKSVSVSEWAEVVEFLDENIWDEDRIMKEWESGKKTGEEQAKAQCKKWLLDGAAEAFTKGNDEDAKRLRNLANALP